MLKITKKVEYALIAISYLQSVSYKEPHSVNTIAQKFGIPKEILAKAMQELCQASLLESIKGPHGGYKLLKNPSTIKMTEFFEILEGPIGIMDCYIDENCEQIQTCNIKGPVAKVNNSLRAIFSNLTLADMA